ncbi:hypothetical protein O181_048774 [Austropuccinia psidii MF-1]|uniref:Integrase catalytic domain-containing protein n=1 Tax=Austropuccinia psidii MF-1 TaxID=1389203 RepID=A0A9Q3DTI2_9BASI|nr:hypothetical protein [Austropuccinia psidii MF-1]
MANLQADSSSEASRPPAFKTPSMKAPECFDGTQPFKVRSFIQYCQLIFHNDQASHPPFQEGLPSRILDQLAFHPSRIGSLQDLMDLTLELDTSNDFSTAKSCAVLVGDSRTPSFPYSVHIPSLNSNPSLLSSRDEVFKEIQNVGEDNSVSSLHLFFGNMDLPPSSSHDSLEELKGPADSQLATSKKPQGSPILPWLFQFLLPFNQELFKENKLNHQFPQEIFLFSLNEKTLSHFNQLKEAFTTAQILSHFNPSLQTIVEPDASNYALGAVLSQVYSGKHPIAFNSHKLIPAELNYEIHEKELLGIVWALKRWRAFLLSISSPFKALANHSSLQYFMASKILTRCQAHWAEFFSEFHFSITYHPGLLATLPDALSYWVVVPNDLTIQLRILKKHHYSPLAGHPGKEKTLKLVKWDFHWSSMTQFIKNYVSSCQRCSINKNIHHKKFGFLKPLPIPNGLWIFLSIDFITPLPLSNSFDSGLVIVGRFSKMAVFIPTMSSITSLDLAHLFIKNIFSNHGLPSSIFSDRGSLFVSSFWPNLCQQLKISSDLSTAYHPETDGQTERENNVLENYLLMYVSYHQDDWNTWLPLAESAYNNCNHSSTKK